MFSRLQYISKQDKRTNSVIANVGKQASIKILNTLLTFLIISLSLSVIDTESYGIFVAISSVSTWIYLFDFGLSNGLTNKIAEITQQRNPRLASEIITTTYGLISIVVITATIVSFILIDIQTIGSLSLLKNILPKYKTELKIAIAGAAAMFVLKPIYSILMATQRHYLISAIQFVANIFTVGILLTGKFVPFSFKSYIITTSLILPITLACASLILFSNSLKFFRPSVKNFNLNTIRETAYISLKFFTIQSSIVILTAYNNIYLINMLNSTAVTQFSVSTKYYSIAILLHSLVLTPLWPAFTQAIINHETEWIEKTMRRLNYFNAGCFLFILLLALVQPIAFSIWTTGKISIPFSLNIFFALNAIVSIHKETFVSFVNGSGRLNLQMFYSIIVTILHIAILEFMSTTGKRISISLIVIMNTVWLLAGYLLWKYQYHRIMNPSDENKQYIWK
jgi:O-antigen/teichoic acid export membrane protein